MKIKLKNTNLMKKTSLLNYLIRTDYNVNSENGVKVLKWIVENFGDANFNERSNRKLTGKRNYADKNDILKYYYSFCRGGIIKNERFNLDIENQIPKVKNLIDHTVKFEKCVFSCSYEHYNKETDGDIHSDFVCYKLNENLYDNRGSDCYLIFNKEDMPETEPPFGWSKV